MKKIFLILLISLSLHKTYAQSDRSNIVKIGFNGFAWEHVLNSNSSIEFLVPIGYASASSSASINGVVQASETSSLFASGLGLGYRFYFPGLKNAPRGIYISPSAELLFGTLKNSFSDGTSDQSSFHAVVAKGVFGYQWVWGSGLSLDLNGGIGYYSYGYQSGTNLTNSNIGANGVTLTGNLALGYAF